jgi:AraC family transcriptional regulator, regulatory protein of adaptative response / methylated-DNA-[protein]-cysteine methyltransferase
MTDQQTQDQYWQAILDQDGAWDGSFVYGVLTTGVYCRPSCRARTPLRKNVRFYPHREAAQQDGLRACKRCRPDADPEALNSLMVAMCRYIEKHHDQRLSLDHLATQAGMSPSHFQRRFKHAIGMSPKKYQDACRITRFKNQLKAGDSITTAMQNSGYDSSSRLYEKLDTHMGMTPSSYRQGGAHELISYAADETALGTVMIGATDRGICFLQFGENAEALLAQLTQEYPRAEVAPMPPRSLPVFRQWMTILNNFLEGTATHIELPLDIRGTAFQRRVWEYLTTIPAGELRSYTEVAKGIGKPRAVRAVASACANNKIAIAIPCHRVIRGDGNLAGYKWGLARKRTLIDRERQGTHDYG